ncbi:MAG: LytTR family DNA-binding domain-containing protein [Erythrobacter sp.]
MDESPSAPAANRRPRARKIVIDLAIMTVIGIVMALIGPFGSFEVPLAVRLVAWLSFAYVGYAIYSPMSFFVHHGARALDLPQPLLWVLAVAVATVPMTAIVWVMNFIPGPVPLPSLEAALTQYFYVFVIGGGVTALFYALESRGETSEPVVSSPRASHTEPALKSSGPPNPLLDQLPAALGGEVIALEMEDHYVRVHTALGSELVLMRLRDAMAHVANVDGRQVHRSWWVARLAVEDVRREGRNVRLLLANGIEAPVSRAQVGELRDAGWI